MFDGYVIDWDAWTSSLALMAAIASSLAAYIALRMQLAHRDEDFHISWNQGVVSWANSCIELTSQMSIAVKNGVELSGVEILEIQSGLSSRIDQGRLLFENDKNTEYGLNKPSAYRGFRPTLLDNLVRAYDNFDYAVNQDYWSLDEARRVQISSTVLVEQRGFVSEIQSIIDPSWFHTKAKNFKREI